MPKIGREWPMFLNLFWRIPWDIKCSALHVDWGLLGYFQCPKAWTRFNQIFHHQFFGLIGWKPLNDLQKLFWIISSSLLINRLQVPQLTALISRKVARCSSFLGTMSSRPTNSPPSSTAKPLKSTAPLWPPSTRQATRRTTSFCIWRLELLVSVWRPIFEYIFLVELSFYFYSKSLPHVRTQYLT